MKRDQTRKPESFADLAVKAMKEAVADVVKAHAKEGLPLHVWEEGKIVSITPGRPKQGSRNLKPTARRAPRTRKKTG